MRWRGLTIIGLTAASAIVPVHSGAAQSGLCAVAGRYGVVGRVPGASGSYKGEAVIVANSTGCEMRWFPPNESAGTGHYSNGVLTIHFRFANGGATGVVRYQRAANGEMHGVWWMNGSESSQGTETLRPL